MQRRTRTPPFTNRLLDRLPARARSRVLAGCEEVQLSFAQTLDLPGETIAQVYFPTGCSISLISSVDTRSRLEVALVGNEGFYGVPVALGLDVAPVHALVQGAGPALRMRAGAFRRELEQLPALRECIQRYIFVVMGQVTQAAGCNRFHVVEQRMARWLLMTADRSRAQSLRITHELLASMLGVRRVGVTQAAMALQGRNLIDYHRGSVNILDRKGLERASCACYRADIAAYERILG